jgi:hypothetical protein
MFARGNVDVHDTIVASRTGEHLTWNGINELLRPLGVVARVVHETAVRSDVLATLPQPIPVELAEREPQLALGAFPLASQFATRLYDGGHDVIVLSIVQDAMTGLVRHRRAGWSFFPGRVDAWPADARRWARSELEPIPPLTAEQAGRALDRVIARIRVGTAAPIVVFNASTYVPGDTIHCHAGLDDALAVRLAQFDVMLAEVSRRTAISIVDVDRVIAGAGAATHKLDALHYTAEGYELICRELTRVLADLGVLDEAAREPSR